MLHAVCTLVLSVTATKASPWSAAPCVFDCVSLLQVPDGPRNLRKGGPRRRQRARRGPIAGGAPSEVGTDNSSLATRGAQPAGAGNSINSSAFNTSDPPAGGLQSLSEKEVSLHARHAHGVREARGHQGGRARRRAGRKGKRADYCTVEFFKNDWFQGQGSQFYLGYFHAPDHMPFSTFEDNTVSSFRITGIPECIVTLFGSHNFFGWAARFGPGDWDCTTAISRGFVNDDTSSFRVEVTSFPVPGGATTTTKTNLFITTDLTTRTSGTSYTPTTLTQTQSTVTSSSRTVTSTTQTYSTTTHTHTSLTYTTTSRTTTSITYTTFSSTKTTSTRTSTSRTTTSRTFTITSTTRTTTTRTTTTRSTVTVTYTSTTRTTTSRTTTSRTSMSKTPTTTSLTLTSDTQTVTTTSVTSTTQTTTTTTTKQTFTSNTFTSISFSSFTFTSLSQTSRTYTYFVPSQGGQGGGAGQGGQVATATATSTTAIQTTTAVPYTPASTTTPPSAATTTTAAFATMTVEGVAFANEGFEYGSSTPTYEYACNVPGWTVVPSYVNQEQTCPLVVRGGRSPDDFFGGTDAVDGNYYLGLQRNGVQISQTVPRHHEAGAKYRLEFYIAKRGLSEQDPVLRVWIDGQQMGDFTATTRSMRLHTVEYFPTSANTEFKLENASPDVYGTVYIDNIKIMENVAGFARCQDLLTNESVWGRPALGIDVVRFTSGSLKWIGCNGNGCARNSFYCDDVTGLGIMFGTTDTKALRVVAGSMLPTTGHGCATSTNPDGLLNAMDTDYGAQVFCQQLGYATGVLLSRDDTNTCPEIQWDGQTWATDFVTSHGFGKEYQCLEISSTTTTSYTDTTISVSLTTATSSSTTVTTETISSTPTSITTVISNTTTTITTTDYDSHDHDHPHTTQTSSTITGTSLTFTSRTFTSHTHVHHQY